MTGLTWTQIILTRRLVIAGCAMALLATSSPARGHFLWLKSIDADGRPQAFLYFGENAADEAYRMPEKLNGTEVWRRAADGSRTKLATKPLDTAERIGLIAPLEGTAPFVLESRADYGLYHGTKLDYFAKHVRIAGEQKYAEAAPAKDAKFDVSPRLEGDQLKLLVTADGKPAADATVSITVGDAEAVEKTADANGLVEFKLDRLGVIGILANRSDAKAKGEYKGEPFTGTMSFVSLTIDRGTGPGNPVKKIVEAKPQNAFALPEALASFGAAVSDGWLYVYGGHTGESHSHSSANLSKHFRRVQIGGREWDELPTEAPLQGLALVAHGGRLYRIGGMNARNATTEQTADMHSTDSFAVFDPAKREWTPLAPLPAPRSSHDAVVIGEKLYVVGGWTLAGTGGGKWIDDAIVFDLAKPQAGWAALPKAEFQRRALAAGEWRGKLVVMGGISSEGSVIENVSIFDPATSKWAAGPAPPAGDMAGFGVSAWNLEGHLYVSGLPGVLYRLSNDGTKWEDAAKLKTPRFFHRLLPTGKPNTFMAIGGAAEDGQVADIELLDTKSNN